MLELRDYQSAALDNVRREFAQGRRRVVLVAPTGSGKCLGEGTRVLMFDGRTVAVEDVVAGDLLMGPDSTPRRVLSTASGHGPLRRIVPLRGESWVCNDAHVLTLIHTQTNEIVDVNVEDWRKWSKNRRHLFKQFSAAVDFGPGRRLPIDPYLLGVWLGDGTKHTGRLGLTSISISKPDPELVLELRRIAHTYGCLVNTSVYGEGKCPTHRIVTERGQPNPLLDLFRDTLGPDLEIPFSYLTSSRQQRLELLAGIIDTDGYIAGGSVEIVQKRQDYAEGITFVARSLGFRVKKSIKVVNREGYWRLSIAGDHSVVPTRIPRKKADPRRMNKDVTRTGFTVEDMPDGKWFGFTLDGDGRFLLGNFVVTHNTVMAAAIIHGALAKGHSVCFLAHRKELIDQPSKMLDSLGIDHGVIKAKHWRHRPHLPVQVASVQTLALRGTRPPTKIIIVDEAHRARARQYEEIFGDYPDALILGLTATPVRLDGRGLVHIFQSMVKVASVAHLIEVGHLCQPRLIVPPPPDMSDVSVSHGEFNSKQAAAKIDRRIIGNIVEHWKKYAEGRPTIVFAPSVEKSLEIVENFRAAGVRAAHVDGKMGDRERGLILAQLATQEIQVCSNVNLLVEGFDLPIISCVVVASPSKSITRWLQMCGRGSRTDPSKSDFLIIDHAGCFYIHGSPTHDWDWSLDDGAIKKEGIESFSICEVCFSAFSNGQSCPTCGSYKFVVKELGSRVLEETDDELHEVNLTSECPECESTDIRIVRGPGPFDMRINCGTCKHTTYTVDRPKASRATMGDKRSEYFRLAQVAIRQNYKRGWADHRYYELFDAWPGTAWKRQITQAQTRSEDGGQP